MWVEKEHIPAALKVMKKWKFEYVENLAWVQKHVNNRFVEKDWPYFTKSKLTLLICRRGKGGLELRHQRNPDVVFDALRFTKEDEGGTREDKPASVYTMIETLLPDAKYDSTTGKFGLLELYAATLIYFVELHDLTLIYRVSVQMGKEEYSSKGLGQRACPRSTSAH
jgi:hypothetical protein